MSGDWLSTGEVATLLGVSRQHVVDLCERGELPCAKAGTHRRIRRSDLERRLGQRPPSLTREQEKSLWLHRALMGHLMLSPDQVLATARSNIASWGPMQRSDGMAARYLQQWERVIDDGVNAVCDVLTGTDEASRELRANSPFAGVISETERRQVLRSFREHWDRQHAA